MSGSGVVFVVLLLGAVGFFLSCVRSRSIEMRGMRMHSRSHYYGWWTFLLVLMPSFLFLLLWKYGCDVYLEYRVSAHISRTVSDNVVHNRSLAAGLVRDLANNLSLLGNSLTGYQSHTYASLRDILGQKGAALSMQGKDYMVPVAIEWAERARTLNLVGYVVTLVLALSGFFSGIRGVSPENRARNRIERFVICGLVIASAVAILTTVGIVLSMLFQTVSFFRSVSVAEFFFGTVWDPRFSAVSSSNEIGQFGLLPLLAGTLYIAFVAMFFAVPIGLFAAIYMSEYATPRLRSIIKPLLEILAGIPTIVYGFFALVTVGPFLRDLSMVLSGGQGFIMAQSVLTAGLVMGIMLVPFVSSLSDDVMTAVPRALRDGSLGLGATRSETVRRVVFPAALPGIAAALLMTASRAIGETMIVVLAAGVAARTTINPFEAMTTITVKIVNQLTGDLAFDSPQTLVAFALGMTLFVLTLLMNVLALYIVRKYKEQYE